MRPGFQSVCFALRYNLGNVLGRMLCQWYKPHTAGLALCLNDVVHLGRGKTDTTGDCQSWSYALNYWSRPANISRCCSNRSCKAFLKNIQRFTRVLYVALEITRPFEVWRTRTLCWILQAFLSTVAMACLARPTPPRLWASAWWHFPLHFCAFDAWLKLFGVLPYPWDLQLKSMLHSKYRGPFHWLNDSVSLMPTWSWMELETPRLLPKGLCEFRIVIGLLKGWIRSILKS